MNTSDETTDAQRLAHGLRWSIKGTFVDYVRRMADGTGSVGDGAVPVGTGDLFFEYDAATSTEATAAAGAPVHAFRGDVRFSGHYGMLFVRIAHPRIELGAEGAVLTIADPQAREDGQRLTLATLGLRHVETRSGTEVHGSDDVALTADGVELFNDVYPAGEPFDPLVIQLPVG
jgi:hypothetical protein